MLFIWVASRSGPTVPGQPPERFAGAVAAEISAALERDPQLDLQQFVRAEYGGSAHPVFVMMTDGRMAGNGGTFPEALVRQAQEMLRRGPMDFERFSGRRTLRSRRARGIRCWAGSGARPPDPSPGPGRGFGPGRTGFRPPRPAFIASQRSDRRGGRRAAARAIQLSRVALRADAGARHRRGPDRRRA